MTKIILDTNIILRHPKILGLQIPELEFLVPLDVIAELNYRASQRGAPYDHRVALIEIASQQGTVKIVNTDLPPYRKYIEGINTNKLSRADIAIVLLGLTLINNGHKVKIATQDREIWEFANNYKIEILSEEDLTIMLATFDEPTTELSDSVQKEILSFESTERSNFFIGTLAGSVITFVALIAYKNIDKIIGTINVWGTLIIILFAGVGLFVFREKNRLSYGVFEFLVGVFAIILLFQPNHFNLSALDLNLDFNVRLLGGLYIMVRGQDNIVKGIQDTKIGLYLKDKFGIGM